MKRLVCQSVLIGSGGKPFECDGERRLMNGDFSGPMATAASSKTFEKEGPHQFMPHLHQVMDVGMTIN